MIHDFDAVGDGCYRCKVCGIKVYTSGDIGEILLECRGPALATQVAHYAEAVVTHVATGSKCRSDEEVDELLKICKECEFYNSEKSKCRVCGCKLSDGGALSNKLRMESQHCPKKKW